MTTLKSPNLERPETFLLDCDAGTGVAVVTLSPPAGGKALTPDIYRELGRTMRALDTEPEVRSIVITGQGRGFCGGGDMADIVQALAGASFEELHRFTRMTCDLVLAIRHARQPVIGALNGTVTGAGAVIAAACDVRIAARSARIAYPFTRLGLSGADMGAAWLLPRIVGMGRASELLLTGAFIDSGEAHRIGLYNRVVPDETVVSESVDLARDLAQGPSFALGMTKDALNREATAGLEEALDMEARAQATCMMNPNFREAYRALVEERQPRFD